MLIFIISLPLSCWNLNASNQLFVFISSVIIQRIAEVNADTIHVSISAPSRQELTAVNKNKEKLLVPARLGSSLAVAADTFFFFASEEIWKKRKRNCRPSGHRLAVLSTYFKRHRRVRKDSCFNSPRIVDWKKFYYFFDCPQLQMTSPLAPFVSKWNGTKWD